MAATTIERDGRIENGLPAGIVALLGLGIGALAVEFLATHPDPTVFWRVELLATVGVSGAIAYGGYRLADSGYDATDLWAILAWCLLGLGGAVLIGGGIYAHQVVERASVAEPTFLFEFLALLGAGVGLAFGVNRRSRLHGAAGVDRPVEDAEVDRFWAVLSELGEDPEPLRRRWTIVRRLATTTTRELPTEAFVVELSKTEAFPEDREATRRLLDEHLDPLARNGLVEVDEDRQTVRYVGPEALAAHFEGAGRR